MKPEVTPPYQVPSSTSAFHTASEARDATKNLANEGAHASSVAPVSLSRAFDRLPHPTYLKDKHQRLMWVNAAFCEFFGTSRERCCSQPEAIFLNTLIAADGTPLQAEDPHSHHAAPITEERTVTNIRGEVRILSVTGTWCTEETTESYWLISLTDVTNLRAETCELKRIAHLSEVARQAVNEGVWEIEISLARKGRSVYSVWWSQQFRQLLGYEDETEFPNQLTSWIGVIHPDDRDWVLSALKDASGNAPFDVEYRMYTKTNEMRWFRSVSRSLIGDIGSSRRMVGMLRDVTDRKLAQEELQHQQNMLRAVLDNIPHRVWLQDKSWRYLAANRAFCEARGRSPEEVIGMSAEELLPPDQLKIFREEDEAIMASRKTLMLEEALVTADNRTHWFSTIKSPFLDDQGKVIGLTGVSMDITARKEAEEAVQQANEALEHRVEERTETLQKLVAKLQQEVSDRQKAEAALRQSETALRQKAQDLEDALQQLQRTQSQLVQSEKMSSLGQLVAGVAHEINNPINFVYGNLVHAGSYIQDLLELLKLYQKHYPKPDPEIHAQAQMIDLEFVVDDLPKLLKSMNVGAERIQDIVQSLRNFSRMDEAEFKSVNLHEGIESTLLILQNRFKACAPYPEITLIKEYGPLPYVECYASQMNQVFMNILSNALDALEEYSVRQNDQEGEAKFQPCIRIATQVHHPNWVTIELSDNGPGIPEELQTRIFDPFFTTKPVGKGTGLGMSISYQIVTERHGGQLLCTSIPTKGTTFTIEIPIRQGQNKGESNRDTPDVQPT
ncbi:MAG: PAS domain S-box protein [Cyanobacteria bacterium J06638_20]